MKTLKELDYRILTELMKNAKISDRQLAKKLSVSQPTITRRRARMERMNLFEYTIIPDLKELGYGIISFTFVHFKPSARFTQLLVRKDMEKQIKETLLQAPNLIFISTGTGLGFELVSVAVHKRYSEFIILRNEIANRWGDYLENIDSFVISMTGDNMIRFLTLKFLADYIHQQRTD
ncbi:MAG: AsnC family transcriptional regulator [Candidatus Bathyarchaeota archaeon]|nr:MAG: AsnC family transcriptional regulator [Candidatus Bathyarchaeota archaeon]